MDEHEEHELRELLTADVAFIPQAWIEKMLSQLDATRADLKSCQAVVESLAERVAKQSDLLGQRAEKPPSIWHRPTDDWPIDDEGQQYIVTLREPEVDVISWRSQAHAKSLSLFYGITYWARERDLINQVMNDKGVA